LPTVTQGLLGIDTLFCGIIFHIARLKAFILFLTFGPVKQQVPIGNMTIISQAWLSKMNKLLNFNDSYLWGNGMFSKREDYVEK